MNPPVQWQSLPPSEHPKRGVSRFSGRVLVLTCVLLGSLLSYFIITRFVLMSVQIRGSSMSPTLRDGERYILYRAPYLWRAPRQGEIVVLRDPEDNDLSIKRVIGLPFDVVQVKRDGIYVNGIRLSEPYLSSNAPAFNEPGPLVHLGENDYFVLGDNRKRSADSRVYGPVPRKSILGLISKSG